MSQAIRHICYTSLCKSVDKEAFFKIVDIANRRNTDHGVGGIISFDDGIITQIIEGQDSTVRQLFENIQVDPRHHSLMLIANTIIPARQYGVFGMAVQRPLDVAIESISIVRRYGVGDADDAYAERYRRGVEALLNGTEFQSDEYSASQSA